MFYVIRNNAHSNSILVGWEVPEVDNYMYRLVDKLDGENKTEVMEDMVEGGEEFYVPEYLGTFIPGFAVEEIEGGNYLIGVQKVGNSISFSTLKLLQKKANIIMDALDFGEPKIFPCCCVVP